MNYQLTYAAGSPQRDFGKLFTCWQYDNKVDNVVLTLFDEERSITAVDIVVVRSDGYTVVYSCVPGLNSEDNQGITVDGNVVTWAVDSPSTCAIGSTTAQVHVWFDDASGVLANFQFVVRQSHSVTADSYMEFPSAGEVAAQEAERQAAENAREAAETLRNNMVLAMLERCRIAAERCEGIVIGIIPPTEWDDIPDKPTAFPPSAHTHAQSDVTGLSTTLAGKETAGAAATVQSNLNTHANNTTVHITAAERTSWDSKANGTHTHVKADITDLAPVITGNIYNTDSGTFSIATTAWTENSGAGRFEYTLSDSSINTTSRVTIVLGDSFKGKYNIWALDPTSGSIKICADIKPGETVTGRWYTDEVRA